MRQSKREIRGFTLIEAIISIVIVSVMYVAALQTVGSSRVSQSIIADNRRGYELGQQLLAEMMALPYMDPVSGGATLGPDAGEGTGVNRSGFDDVDDYHNWNSAVQLKDGTAMTHLDGWKRKVTVSWVNPADLTTAQGSDSGVKRITITVKRGEKLVATLHAIKANVD